MRSRPPTRASRADGERPRRRPRQHRGRHLRTGHGHRPVREIPPPRSGRGIPPRRGGDVAGCRGDVGKSVDGCAGDVRPILKIGEGDVDAPADRLVGRLRSPNSPVQPNNARARMMVSPTGTYATVARVIDGGLLGQGWSTTAGRCPERRPLHFPQDVEPPSTAIRCWQP